VSKAIAFGVRLCRLLTASRYGLSNRHLTRSRNVLPWHFRNSENYTVTAALFAGDEEEEKLAALGSGADNSRTFRTQRTGAYGASRTMTMISPDEFPNRAFQGAYFLHRERKPPCKNIQAGDGASEVSLWCPVQSSHWRLADFYAFVAKCQHPPSQDGAGLFKQP
jgi:hypothetical protein